MVNKFNKVDIHFKACHNTIKKNIVYKTGKNLQTFQYNKLFYIKI